VVAYTNFYESIKEAEMRIQDTVVLYDGQPYYVLLVSDHKKDGIFRAYLDPLFHPDGPAFNRIGDMPYTGYPGLDDNGLCRGGRFDKWLDTAKGKESGVIRKMMNSPAFDKFRPFPLGMCNHGGKVYYIERQPTRHTQQGLTPQMLTHRLIEVEGKPEKGIYRSYPSYYERSFVNTILGKYPTVVESLEGMTDPMVTDSGVAFHREFAFCKGPMKLLFLAYKEDIVAYLPNNDLTRVVIDSRYAYTKEVISDLGCFGQVLIQ
jgi:hypothetical protein